MSKPIERRLSALEARRGDKGIRIFQESDTPGVFYEMDSGEAYTDSDISALSGLGWQCIKIVYGDWRPSG